MLDYRFTVSIFYRLLVILFFCYFGLVLIGGVVEDLPACRDAGVLNKKDGAHRKRVVSLSVKLNPLLAIIVVGFIFFDLA